jgi:hypothetical protein
MKAFTPGSSESNHYREEERYNMRTLSSALALLIMAGPTASAAPAATTEQTNHRPDQVLLDRLIGTWDVDYTIYDEHGAVRHYVGTAVYQRILDGAAIQEIWSDSHGRSTQPYGTTLEFYDGKRNRWTALWIYPEQGMYYSVSGGQTGSRIVLTGEDQQGVMQRWTDEDFRTNSFVGLFDVSKDGGKTWRLVGVNHMQRHAAD